MITTVFTTWERWLSMAMDSAKSADHVDKPSPSRASAQNGVTSFHRCDRPLLPQTQLRFK